MICIHLKYRALRTISARFLAVHCGKQPVCRVALVTSRAALPAVEAGATCFSGAKLAEFKRLPPLGFGVRQRQSFAGRGLGTSMAASLANSAFALSKRCGEDFSGFR